MEESEYYETFPHRTSFDDRAKKNRAIEIYRELRSAQTLDALKQIKAKRGVNQILWVWNHMKDDRLENSINLAKQYSQLGLFTEQGEMKSKIEG